MHADRSWRGLIGMEVLGEGKEFELANIVVQGVDQRAAPVFHPLIARFQRLFGLSTGLPDAEGDARSVTSPGDRVGDKPREGTIPWQEFGLDLMQEVAELSRFGRDR